MENKDEDKEKKENYKVTLKIMSRTKEFGISVETDSSISTLPQLIDEITASILKSQTFSSEKINSISTRVNESSTIGPTPTSEQNQIQLFAMKIGVDPEKFEKSKLLGIRDQDVQIIKVSQISALEASMIILAVKDLIMNVKPMAYEDWKELCEANGIRSKTPFYKVGRNATDRGYLDKTKYANKELLLI